MLLFKTLKIYKIVGLAIIVGLTFGNIPSVRAESLKKHEDEAKYQANLGSYYWELGSTQQAISSWGEAALIYRRAGSIDEEAEMLLKISRGYLNLGQLEIAIFQSKKLLTLSISSSSLIASTWENLGNAYLRASKLSDAVSAYKTSLEIKKKKSTINNLARAFRQQYLKASLLKESSRPGAETEKYLELALTNQADASATANSALQLFSRHNTSEYLQTLIEVHKSSSEGLDDLLIVEGRAVLSELPSSKNKVFLLINWAKVDSDLAEHWLDLALSTASSIGDDLALCLTFLEKSYFSFSLGNRQIALQYVKNSIAMGRLASANFSLYRAHWLAAKIYQQLGQTKTAYPHYQEAIANLETFNQGMVTITPERRLKFKTEIEPIYREFLELLLVDNPIPSNLESALVIFDKLRLAQLQNYFGDNCFEILGDSLEILDTLAKENAVSIYSIILPENTHVLLQMSDGSLRHHVVEIQSATINKMANDYHERIQGIIDWNLKAPAQGLYDLVVRAFEKELEQVNPNHHLRMMFLKKAEG